MGLKEQILKSTSEKEIDSLLKKGYTFEMVSNKTKRAWLNAKNKALTYINNPNSRPVKVEKIKVVKKKKIKRIKF